MPRATKLESLAGRITAYIENFYRGVPRLYEDYLETLEEIAGPGAQVKPETLFRKHKRSEFPFGEVYSYAQADYLRSGDTAVLVRHTGWRVDAGDTRVIIVTGYRVDVLAAGQPPGTRDRALDAAPASPPGNNNGRPRNSDTARRPRPRNEPAHNNNTPQLQVCNNNNKYRKKK